MSESTTSHLDVFLGILKGVYEKNGTPILDTALGKVTKFMGRKVGGKDRKDGHFGFAGHGSPIEYRNVRIKRLE